MELRNKIELHYNNFFEITKNAEFTVYSSPISIDQWFYDVIGYLNKIKQNKNKIFFLGNGASASIADHFATDFTKNGLIPCFSNTEAALLTCFSNDFSYENAYAEILKRKMSDGDGLIVISSSGASKNLVNAANFVKNNYKDSGIISFTSFNPENPLRKLGTYNLYLMASEYSFAESGHAYYLHLLTDLFCTQDTSINEAQVCQTNIE